MSIQFDTEKTSNSLDENVFDDAKRALAPSGVTPKQFVGPDGSMRHMSPHMVNVHQFYPEIDFSLDKGTVGEVVESPKVSARPLQKSLSKIDLKETIVEEDGVEENDAEATSESPKTDLDNEMSFYTEEKNARRGKVQVASVSSESDDESEELFQTEVDEKIVEDAKSRQLDHIDGVFYPEHWGKMGTDYQLTVENITSKKAQEHFEIGRDYFEENRLEKAVTALTKAINLNPGVIHYYTFRAEIFFVLTDFQSAILNYKKACVMDPDNTQFYNRLAFIYYFTGQCLFDQKLFPESLESFSRAAEMRPEIAGYHMRSIACLAALQRHGECLALVNKRLEAENVNPDLYVMRARLHQLFRNTTLCYYDVKDALAINPDHDQANKLLAQLQFKSMELKNQSTNLSLTGRFRDSLQKIALAIETNPAVAEFHNIRGACHRKLGDFNAAIDDYLLALDKTDHNEDDPVYIEAQRQLLLTYNDFAVECFNKGFYEEAIILLNKAIKGEKNEKGLYINRGDCFFKEGNLQFALADYNQALDLDERCQLTRKRVAVIHNEYGVQEYMEKHNKEAEAKFTLAIHNDRVNAKYYISRSRARNLLENVHGARQDALMAIHLQPNNPEIPSLMHRYFHGKNTKEILGSQAAMAVRKQLHTIIGPHTPPKLQPISTVQSRATTSHPMLPSAGSSSTLSYTDSASDVTVRYEQQPIPSIGSHFASMALCMSEKQFNAKVVEERREISNQIKDCLHNRGSLGEKGVRSAAMPDADFLKRKVPGYRSVTTTSHHMTYSDRVHFEKNWVSRARNNLANEQLSKHY